MSREYDKLLNELKSEFEHNKIILNLIVKGKNLMDAETYNKFFKEQKIIIENDTKELLEIYKKIENIKKNCKKDTKEDTKNCIIMSPKKKIRIYK